MAVLKIALCIVASLSFIWLLKVFSLLTYPDFTIYYLSAKTLLLHGNPYYHVVNTKDTFLYEPIVLFLFIPFTFFTLVSAGHLFTFISLCSLLLALFYLLRIGKIPLFSWQAALLVTVTCLYFPTKFTLGMGQINMLTLLLTTSSMYYYFHKKVTTAGLLLGVSIIVKFFPLLFLVYFLFHKSMKTFATAAATIIIFLLMTWLTEPQLTALYIIHILPNLLHAHPTAYYNQAFSGFIWRTFPYFIYTNITQLGFTVFFFLLTVVVIWKYLKKKKEMQYLIFGLMITTSIICNSFSWQHHFILLLPAYFFVFIFLQNLKSKKWFLYVIVAISYLLTATNISQPSAFPLLLQAHVFYGGLLLYIETLYILYRYDS